MSSPISNNARHRDFGAPAKITDYAPLTFTVAGEEFNCKPAIQGATLLHFVSEADSNDSGRSAAAIREFFGICMEPEDFTRFWMLVEGEDYIFDMEELTNITGWLVEQYSSRPKGLSKRSSNGQKESGTMSTDDAS